MQTKPFEKIYNHTNEYSPKVKMIRDHGVSIVRGIIFREARKELMKAVKGECQRWA